MSTDRSGLDGLVVQRADESSLSFVVCLSDEAVLKANLLASPCLGPSSPHEVIAVRNAPSVTEPVKMGLSEPESLRA